MHHGGEQQAFRQVQRVVRLPTGTARRYAIWELQVEAGLEPCFATSVRFSCENIDCPWRGECLDLRATWRR